MPRSGSLAVLVAKRTLSPGSPLFANGVQVQGATQTYTGKHVVADENSVTGTLFNSTAQNPSEAYRWNLGTHCWTQLSARATHDDLIRIGADVHQWTWLGSANQQRSLTDLGGGYYRLTARHSCKVLEVANFSAADGGNIPQWSWTGTTSQQWQIVP